MKRIMTVLFILLLGECRAATGNASDGPLMAIAVIGILLILIGTGYFIDLMKNKLRQLRARNLNKKKPSDQDGECLTPFDRAIIELNDMSTI